MKVAVTGSGGFIGKHIVHALHCRSDTEVQEIYRNSSPERLEQILHEAAFVFHLAGVNRPVDVAEFARGNQEVTGQICQILERGGRRPTIVFSSSTQAGAENPYGQSKLEAEKVLRSWTERSGGAAIAFRIPNVFGKWCRPNYNSVIATFCHSIAHDLPITISDPARVLELVYIDDVVNELLAPLDGALSNGFFEKREVSPTAKTSLGDLAAKIRSFKESRTSLTLPSFEDDFTRRLYATYLSYLDGASFAYSLGRKDDQRGSLAEFMKSSHFGQIFVSRTNPGITRGNHFHNTKAEKFLVVEGSAVIRLRSINGGEIIEYRVSGDQFKVVDIPPGYTHSIENIGSDEMVTLFWASEIFDPRRPDTTLLPVQTN